MSVDGASTDDEAESQIHYKEATTFRHRDSERPGNAYFVLWIGGETDTCRRKKGEGGNIRFVLFFRPS